jgi:hypothetical protein
MGRTRGPVNFRQLNIRAQLQMGGALPGNPVKYLGVQKGQARAGSFTPPVSGRNQINRPSDVVNGEFQTIGSTKTAPDQGTIGLQQDVRWDQVTAIEEIYDDSLPVAIHILFSSTGTHVGAPNAWDSKIVIPDAELTGMPLSSDFQGPDSDETLTWNAEFGYSQKFSRAVRLTWQPQVAATVTTPITGVAFGESRRIMYAIGRGDGSANEPRFYYSTNGGRAWTGIDLDLLSHTGEDPLDLAYTGGYLVAPTAVSTGSYIWAPEASAGTAAGAGWTEVATGFVNTNTPNKIYAPSLTRIFMAAENGYIYLLENIGSGVSVLTDGSITTEDQNWIDGYGDCIVTCGDANTMMVSINGGESWSLVTGPVGATVLNTVSVLSEDCWVVGAANGNAYYTKDGGDTWNTMGGIPGSGSGSIIAVHFDKDNPAFGLLSHRTAGNVARVYRTTDAGNVWEQTSLSGYPTSNTCSKFATWGPNTLLAGGIATTTTDGILALAKNERLSDSIIN